MGYTGDVSRETLTRISPLDPLGSLLLGRRKASRVESAPGVSPGSRRASPNVSGWARLSRSTISFERPAMFGTALSGNLQRVVLVQLRDRRFCVFEIAGIERIGQYRIEIGFCHGFSSAGNSDIISSAVTFGRFANCSQRNRIAKILADERRTAAC